MRSCNLRTLCASLQHTTPRRVIGALIAILFALVLLSFLWGRYPVSAQELCLAVGNRLFPNWVSAPASSVQVVVFQLRTPRILAACLVGCCLAAAGAAYQGVFQNPMASPDILGSTAGATFGAALAILWHLSGFMISVFAFCFSLLTVCIVYAVSLQCKGKQVLTLILTGMMVSSLFSAGTAFIKLVADPYDELPAITYWTMGSLSSVTMSDLAIVAFPMALGLGILYAIRWQINLITLGDAQARTLGLPVRVVRVLIIFSATLITASSVAISGMIGWVGLVIPHLARRLVGNDYRVLLPTSMLFGAAFLLAVDNVSRSALSTEIPIGILTAFIGAPFFLSLIMGKESVL